MKRGSEKKVSDGKMLTLVKAFLNASVMETGMEWTPTGVRRKERCMSPLLANIYLDPLDHLMQEEDMRWYGTQTTLWSYAEAEAEAEERWRRCRTLDGTSRAHTRTRKRLGS